MSARLEGKLVKTRRTTTNVRSGGTNWILIAGGALLSTLTIRIGCRLRRIFERQSAETKKNTSRGHATGETRRTSGACPTHTNSYSFMHEDDGCCRCHSGLSGHCVDIKGNPTTALSSDSDLMMGQQLAVVTRVPSDAPDIEKEPTAIWSSSPERLELPRRPFHQSTGSESPCVSECGSDIFSKREVIHKLRQQLKRRDDMILDMQAKILELQSVSSDRVLLTNTLQSQLDTANRDLFEAEREIQRLRKVIADRCAAGPDGSPENWNRQLCNGHANGAGGNGWAGISDRIYTDGGEREGVSVSVTEMLRKEVMELKEVIEGKDYLVQSYKEQKTELSSKVKELQLRLDSQLPSIL